MPVDLIAAIDDALRWARVMTCDVQEDVIVFDLDDTLIDEKCKPLLHASDLLYRAQSVYDKVILYSHGSDLHVDECTRELDFDFDLILNRGSVDNLSCNKNLLSIYNYFNTSRFNKAVLVDDSVYNWTPEYTRILVPFKLNDLKYLREYL